MGILFERVICCGDRGNRDEDEQASIPWTKNNTLKQRANIKFSLWLHAVEVLK